MSSIVVGSGLLAETMAGLLCAAGTRVSIVAPSSKIRSNAKFDSPVIRNILQADSEKKIPFEFVDDLKQQICLAEKNFRKIRITTDLSKLDTDASEIFDACNPDESALLNHTIHTIPHATLISLSEKPPIHQNHVSLKMYSPIEETRIVKMFTNPKTTRETEHKVSELLNSLGFTVLSEEDSIVADRLVLDMKHVEKSSQLSKLATILMNPLSIPSTPQPVKDQYQLF